MILSVYAGEFFKYPISPPKHIPADCCGFSYNFKLKANPNKAKYNTSHVFGGDYGTQEGAVLLLNLGRSYSDIKLVHREADKRE